MNSIGFSDDFCWLDTLPNDTCNLGLLFEKGPDVIPIPLTFAHRWLLRPNFVLDDSCQRTN